MVSILELPLEKRKEIILSLDKKLFKELKKIVGNLLYKQIKAGKYTCVDDGLDSKDVAFSFIVQYIANDKELLELIKWIKENKEATLDDVDFVARWIDENRE